MNSYRHLYPQITDFDNLYRAWRKARRGKRYKSAFRNRTQAKIGRAVARPYEN
jgi:hypothetical protein